MKKTKVIRIVLIFLIVILLFLALPKEKEIIKTSKNNNSLKAMNTVQYMENLDYYEEEFWEWNTRTTTNDKAYNGTHIQITNTDEKKAIDFYGYGVNSYKDYLYKQYPYAGEKIFRFTLEEVRTDYHTLDGAGFIFNAKKEDGKLTGDVLLLNQNKINLYRLEDVDDEAFQNTANRVMTHYASSILASVNKPASSVHEMEIRTSPTNITVIDNEEEILNVDLDYTTHAGDDFGLLVSYSQHNCSSLSKIEFSEFNLELKDYNLPLILKNDIEMRIEGAIFELLDNEGNVLGEGTTDENGLIQLRGLKAGEYKIRQKTTIPRHIIYSEEYPLTITGDGKAYEGNIEDDKEIEEIIIINPRILADVIVDLKNDIDMEIEGGTFILLDENGKVVYRGATNEDGIMEIKNLTPGKYTLKQQTTIAGHEIYTGTNEFTITDEGKVVDNSTNKEIEQIEVINNRIKEENTDDGRATGVLPQTGERIIFGMVFLTIIAFIAVFYFKYKNIEIK